MCTKCYPCYWKIRHDVFVNRTRDDDLYSVNRYCIQFSSGVSPTFAVIITRCKPSSVSTVVRPPAGDDSIWGESKTSPVDSVWGSVRDASSGGRDKKNKKKKGGDYRRLLSRIRLVIIVISTVRNARVSASVCVKHEKRSEKRETEKKEKEKKTEKEKQYDRKAIDSIAY